MTRIYLDYNASTPLAPAVTDAMMPLLTEGFGNPSASHWAAASARAAVQTARDQVARLLGANSEEIVFTSGGSEANNHALKGSFFARTGARGHIITSTIEHPAISQPLEFLKRLGLEVTAVPVDRYGLVDPGTVEAAIRDDTFLISIMHSNNEVGTIQPIREIARSARARNILTHTDAAQSVGKTPVDVEQLGVDLLSVAGHKLYAPKGVGALYIRNGVTLEPILHGASHESGRRAGTENVLLIAGLGAAAALAQSSPCKDHLRQLRDRFWEKLSRLPGGLILNGHPNQRLTSTLNVSFEGMVGSELLAAIPQIAASTGSACHEGRIAISPVLAAMGIGENTAKGAVRFSFGRQTTLSEVDRATDLIADHLRRCRDSSRLA